MELIYLSGDLNSTIERILSDKELENCGLNKEKVLKTLNSFQGDEIAVSVFYKKYALRNENNEIIEFTLEEAKDRWANAVAQAEGIMNSNPDKYVKYFRELYDYMLPAGRQMYALGNDFIPKASFSNCYATKIGNDSIEGIFDAAKKIAKTFSYGGGIGLCIGELRPSGATVSNSARYSTGAVSFMELYSMTTKLIGQCVAKGQNVLTTSGLVPIEKVKVGDDVWTKNGFIKVINTFINGKKKIFKITDKYGYTLRVSEDHIVMTENNGKLEEIAVKYLNINDSIILIPGKPVEKQRLELKPFVYEKIKYSNKSNRLNENVFLPKILDEKLAYVLGYSYGDGHISYDKFNHPCSIALACSNDWNDIKTKLKEYIKEIFNYDVKISNGDGDLENLKIHSKLVVGWLKENNLLKQRVGELVFPEKIKNSTSSVQMAFISGFYDADGKRINGKSSYSIDIVDYKFLQEIKNILMSNGIVSRNHVQNREEKGWRDLYGITIAGAFNQQRALNLLNSSIKVNEANYVANKDTYLTPYTSRSLKVKYNKYNYCPSDGNLSCNCYDKLSNDYNFPNILIKSNIKSINEDGFEETYDIQLEDEHMFYCEGFYIHNSGRRGALMITIPINHPDVEDFIEIKHNNTDKVKHANISIKITDEFMNAVLSDKDFELSFETKHEKIIKIVNARELWNKIVKSAHNSAEPGILFWNKAVERSPSEIYPNSQIHTTNPCVSGDTLIYTADGRGHIPIKDLAEIGDDVPVFCLDNNKKTAIRMMRNPRITGYEPVYKITFDDGNSVKATKNHQFMLKDGEFKRVDELESGDSVRIITQFEASIKEIFNANSNSNSYIWINDGIRTNRAEHRLIAEFFHGKIKKGEIVHHYDYNSKNNNPDNLVIMDKKEHDSFHSKDMIGDKNPMRRAKEFGKEWWDRYSKNMSKAIGGEKNGKYNGITNEKLKEHAIILTKKLGYRFSVNDWVKYAEENNLTRSFSKWRNDNLYGGILGLAKWAALECGMDADFINLDPRSQKHYKKLILQGYNCEINGKDIIIIKKCEICGNEFKIHHSQREICICSKKCVSKFLVERNKSDKMKKASEKTKETFRIKKEKNAEKQLKAYVDLKFNLSRDPKKKEWENYCRDNNIQFRVGKCSYFNGFKQLKEASKDYNHKVVSVEYCGMENVYNGTVDEFHNYCMGAFHSKTKSGKNKYHHIISANCGEQYLPPGGACVLSSLLLHKFVKNPYTENAYFDFEFFKLMIKRGVRHLDNIIELNFGRHALQEQENSARLTRRIGLGITGLADMFASLNIKYDTNEALEITDKIMKIKMEEEYNASIDLAKERGSFELFNPDLHFTRGFCSDLLDTTKERGKKYGLRNVALSTVAPNGSLSIIAQCSSGIEPIFSLSYKRYVNLGEDSDRKEFVIKHQGLVRFLEETSLEELPEFWITAHQVDYEFRIKLQGVIQKYVDSSLSSTINLPSDVSEEVVSDIYINAWKEGLKGITVYREGSREGVLISDEFAKQAGSPEMDTIIRCVRAEGGDKFYIMVSYKNKNVKEPYQVFVLNYKKTDNDAFVKISNSLAKMLSNNGVEEQRIQKYSDRSNNSLVKLTRFLSLSMKTNNLDKAAEILDYYSVAGSLASRLYNILSESLDMKKALCEKCRSSNVRMEEGCVHCLDCSWEKCG